VEELPRQLKERILSRAEGNPFYMEEIIRSLMDSGAIVRDEATGLWQATRDVADIAIPDTLHGVLMARIDRLQEETKRVLQLAAVIGRIFLYRLLAAIAQEERDLDRQLLTLQREEMIREPGGGLQRPVEERAARLSPAGGRGAGAVVPRSHGGAGGAVGPPLGAGRGAGQGDRVPLARG
jgi:hypothetical protein